jgi:SCP-2 sterol transfer family
VTKWLTQEWFDETGAMGADPSPPWWPPGPAARIQVEVTGGPDGDVSTHLELADGRLVSRAPGAVDAADVTLTTVWQDAVAMQRGELDPNVAFMQGKLKVAGSMGVLIALLPVARTPEYQDLRGRIESVTEF